MTRKSFYVSLLLTVIISAGLSFGGAQKGDEALSRLLDGNKRFVSGNLQSKDLSGERRKELAKEGPPDFSVDEFQNMSAIEKLCDALKKDNFSLNNCQIESLNKLLKQSDLYDKLLKLKPADQQSDRLKELKKAYDTNKSESNLITLNRLALEAYYPQETPKSHSGQHPSAIVVACSDSRVPPEIIFDQGLGDLFVIRVAGNVLDPISVGSIDYAASHLHTPLLIILGHDKCGAVTAALETKEKTADNIGAVIRKILPAVKKAIEKGGAKEDILNNAIRENVLVQQKYLLRKSPIVKNLIAAGDLKVVTGIYHMESGEIEIFSEKESRQ